MNRIVIAPLLLIGSALGGCVAMTGAPQPVTKLRATTAWPPHIAETVEQYRSAGTPELRKSRRNSLISRYMAAADDQYDAFVADLSKEMRGTNVGADIGVLALSGLGAVVNGAANELAAGTAFLTGSRASINKELYLERALPAILTSMDANRQRVANRIATNRRLPDESYSIDDALLDLREYERAGNINRAFNTLSEAAVAAFAAEGKTYAGATDSCVAPNVVRPYWQQSNRVLYELRNRLRNGMPAAGSADDAALARIAALAGKNGLQPATKATSVAELETQIAALTGVIGNACTEAEAKDFAAQITGAP